MNAPMTNGPRIICTDGKFRIVRIEDGERVSHVLEKHDGCDALGCERWKTLTENIGATGIARQLYDWVLQHALTCSHMKETSRATDRNGE